MFFSVNKIFRQRPFEVAITSNLICKKEDYFLSVSYTMFLKLQIYEASAAVFFQSVS